MLGGRLGVMLDVWAMNARETVDNVDVTLTFVTGAIAARFYLLPSFWVEGGVGSGHAEVHVGGFSARGDDVPIGLLAAGLGIARGHSWELDLSLRFAQGSSTSSDSGSGNATTGRMVGIGADLTF
jgi:hypothetical protein